MLGTMHSLEIDPYVKYVCCETCLTTTIYHKKIICQIYKFIISIIEIIIEQNVKPDRGLKIKKINKKSKLF